MQAELLRVWEETRKTVLYVTHSIDEAIVLGDRILVMSARPGRIKDVVDVHAVFGRPRYVEQVKSSEQYGGLFGRVWSQLRDEVAAAQPVLRGPEESVSSSASAETLPAGSLVEFGSAESTASAGRMSMAAVEPALSVLSPVLLLLLWEVLARLGVIDIRFFPAPSSIFGTLGEMIRTGELWIHLGTSLQRIGVGFVIGAVPGLMVGLAMGLFSPVRAVIQPLVDGTFPIPKIAVLPLFILMFGIGEESKYAIIATAVIYLVLINTAAGVKNIDRIYLDVGENFHARRLMMFTDVALPGALPMIVAGLKLGMGVALLVIVAAEFVGAKSGLGYLIWTSWQVFQVEKMYAALLVIAVVGLASAIALNSLERWLIPWKHPL
jgi:NitT/TauT family transport system permease protein